MVPLKDQHAKIIWPFHTAHKEQIFWLLDWGPERKGKMKIYLSNPRISSPTVSRSHTCGGVGINNCSLVSERYSATSDLGAQTCQQNMKNLSLKMQTMQEEPKFSIGSVLKMYMCSTCQYNTWHHTRPGSFFLLTLRS